MFFFALGILFPAHAALVFPHGILKGVVFSTRGGLGVPAVAVSLEKTGAETFTLSDGSFIFPPLGPGRYTLRLFASSAGQHKIECSVLPDSETCLKIGIDSTAIPRVTALYSDLPHGSFGGTVFSASGKPLKDAVVRVSGLPETAITDSTGAYRLDNIGAGSYTVTAEYAGCPLASVDATMGPGTRRRLDIVQGLPKVKHRNALPTGLGTIIGTVTDGRTSKPLSAAQVTLPGSGLSAGTDEQGAFRLGDIQSACYDLVVNTSGYGAMRVAGVPVLPQQVTNVSIFGTIAGACEFNLLITPWQEGSIAITALDAADGRPVNGALVTINGLPGQRNTDSLGRVIFPDVASGTWSGKVKADGYSAVALSVIRVIENRVSRYTVNLTPPGAEGPTDTLAAVHPSSTPADTAVADQKGLVQKRVAISADSSATKPPSAQPQVQQGRDSVKQLDRMSIRSAAVRNSDAGMLHEKENSIAMIDGISSAEISRSGAGNAADAMRKVTGATVMDGKYVYVRGLGERYNITLLDGAEAPSPDPDKQTVPLDLFPSALIDNIATIKAATADMPGNWAGGCLDIRTKSLPDKLLFAVGIGSGGNTATTFHNDFLTYKGGSTDWLGFDDGTRALPARLRDTSVHIPSYNKALIAARTDPAKLLLRQLDTITKSFTPTMSPTETVAPVNQSYSLTFGNKYTPFDRPLGFIGSLSYVRKYQMYNNGATTEFMQSNHDGINDHVPKDTFQDNKSKDDVLWGALGRLSVEPFERQTFQFDYLYFRHGQDIAQTKWGALYPSGASKGKNIVASTLDYIEQGMQSIAVKGIHAVPLPEETGLNGTIINWRFADIRATQNEPDLRYFYRSWITDSLTGITTWDFYDNLAPTRYFRSMDENTRSFAADVLVPLPFIPVDSASVKAGGFYKSKIRTFHERRFQYAKGATSTFSKGVGDPANFIFADSIFGLQSTSPDTMGITIRDAYELKGNYRGDATNTGGFVMTDIAVNQFIRLSGGLRFERNSTYSASADTANHDPATGAPLWFSRNTDNTFLPSISGIVVPRKSMNMRLSFSKTVLQPTFREITPYSSFDFKKNKTFYGNINLRQTRCFNYDARWEWYYRPGRLVSAGLFYKKFIDPIEPYVETSLQQDLLQPQNSPSAYATGLELEARAGLDMVFPALKAFGVSGNFALIRAKTKLSDVEKSQWGSTPPRERDFFGASPFVVNAGIQYDHEPSGITAGLFFNLMGRRLVEVGGVLGNTYETPLAQLDLVCAYKLSPRITFKAGVMNILNNDNSEVSLINEREDLSSSDAKGITFSLGASSSF